MRPLYYVPLTLRPFKDAGRLRFDGWPVFGIRTLSLGRGLGVVKGWPILHRGGLFRIERYLIQAWSQTM